MSSEEEVYYDLWRVYEYLSIYLDSQDDKHNEGDEAMDDKVKVDEIILDIVRFKTKRVRLDLNICSVFLITCIVLPIFYTG